MARVLSLVIVGSWLALFYTPRQLKMDEPVLVLGKPFGLAAVPRAEQFHTRAISKYFNIGEEVQ